MLCRFVVATLVAGYAAETTEVVTTTPIMRIAALTVRFNLTFPTPHNLSRVFFDRALSQFYLSSIINLRLALKPGYTAAACNAQAGCCYGSGLGVKWPGGQSFTFRISLFRRRASQSCWWLDSWDQGSCPLPSACIHVFMLLCGFVYCVLACLQPQRIVL